eukprot:376315-Prorocentrum_minimum.AAC.2
MGRIYGTAPTAAAACPSDGRVKRTRRRLERDGTAAAAACPSDWRVKRTHRRLERDGKASHHSARRAQLSTTMVPRMKRAQRSRFHRTERTGTRANMLDSART